MRLFRMCGFSRCWGDFLRQVAFILLPVLLLYLTACGGGGGRDSLSPVADFTFPVDGQTVSGIVTIQVTATDNSGKVVRVEFFVDGQIIGEDTTPPFTVDWNTLQVNNGPHTLTARPWDPSGNSSSKSITVTVQNDIIPPNTIIDSGPSTRTKETTATFQFHSTEPNSTFQCSFDLQPWQECSSPYTLSGVTEGSHNFRIRAIDASGNVDPSPAESNWTVDLTPPSSPTNLTASSGDEEVVLDWDDVSDPNFGGYNIYRSIPPGDFSRINTSPLTDSNFTDTSVTNDTTYEYYVTAVDDVGNESVPSNRQQATPVAVYPETNLNSGPCNLQTPCITKETTATFEFSADIPSTFECKLDSDSWEDCASPISYPNLSEGPHQFEVRAIATTGKKRTDPTPESFNWTVDITPPQVTITSGPANPTNQTSATFEFTSTNTSYQCKLDAGAWEACTSPKTYPGPLAEGPHHFEVHATDEAGNTGLPATYDWVIDITPPDPPILTSTSPPSPSKTSTTPTINGTAEPASTINLYTTPDCTGTISGTGNADNAGNFSIGVTVSPNSTTTFYATATDLAGNTSSCSEGISYTHDDIPPAPPILTSTSPPSPSNNIAPSINGTAEPHSTVRLYTASDCTGPESASGPANSDGNFSIIVSVTPNSTTTFYATATDLAGNTSSCSPGISYTHDDIAPDPPILTSTSPPSPSNTSTTPTINGTAEPASTINLYTTPDCTG
ncbi:MAG: Ig-like domain-containing protein, partial [bacterium JZ-2024 1]